jgi:hypothetical protein
MLGSCHVVAFVVEQPLPLSLHADSVKPRADEVRVSVVPPTAVTHFEEAGYETPYPLSPADAVIATPRWW